MSIPVKIPIGTIAVNKQSFATENTKMAAALAAIGVPLIKENPVTNIYTKEKPCPRAKPGEAGWVPGRVSFHFELERGPGEPTSKYNLAYADANADAAMDILLERLVEKSRETRHQDMELIQIVDEIKKLRPLDNLTHCRRALENRELLIHLVRSAKELVMVRKGEGFVLLSRYAPAATRKALGVE